MNGQLLATLLLASLALLLVLALRRVARRLFGAGPAFSLWLLMPALAAAPWLPWPFASVLPQLGNAVQASPLAALIVHPQNAAANMSVSGSDLATNWSAWLLLSWLAGSLVVLGRLLHCHWQLRRQFRAPTPDERQALSIQLDAGSLERVRIHPIGPAVLCGWPSSILLPPDFAHRFTPQQRRLVLSHEQMHLQRADPWWRLLAELARALLWFHPLVWLALPRFRIDQELACDDATLRQQQHNRSDYARTLLGDFESHRAALVAGWIHPSQLKERLVMLKARPIHSLIRRGGYAVVLAVIASLSLATVAALSVPQPAHAASTQTMPPVISVNILPQGIYWNGDKVTGTSLQHRAVIAARINPTVPVLLTHSNALPAARASAVARSLMQSGLTAVDQRVIDTSPSPEGDAAAGQYGRYTTYRNKRPPRYPRSAIINREQGTVVLKIHYADDGSALGARVEPTGTSVTLQKAALAAALTWRSSATAGAWGRIPIKFSLSPVSDKPLDGPPAPPPGKKWQASADGKSFTAAPADASQIKGP